MVKREGSTPSSTYTPMFIAGDTSSTPKLRFRNRRHSVQSINSTDDLNNGGKPRSNTVYEESHREYRSVRVHRSLNRKANLISKKRNPSHAPRICINVRGRKYETYLDTLDRFPDTLLGNKELRNQYYNTVKKEIVLARNFHAFEAVLFYYQSNGILSRPAWITEGEFEKEITFYQLRQTNDDDNTDDVEKVKKKRLKKEIAEQRPHYKKVLWNLMEHPRTSNAAFVCALISIATILLSVFVICLETMPSIVDVSDAGTRYTNRIVLFYLETTVMVWFTAEYLFRIISAPRAFKFIISFTGIIDLVVILPYYINTAIGEEIKTVNLAVFRILRMFRVFRIFKLTRYSTGLKVLGKTIIESFGQLAALFLCLFLSAILFSSCLYYIEHVEEPDSLDSYNANNVFISIPDTFWYVIITMTSVGYGDVVPRTIIGRIVAAFCMISGIIVLICLPTPVFVTHFGRFYEDVISRPDAGSEHSEDTADDELWYTNEPHLMVPTWINDPAWKDKIRNDYNQNLILPGLNVYLSTSNLFLSNACSTEYLNQSPS